MAVPLAANKRSSFLLFAFFVEDDLLLCFSEGSIKAEFLMRGNILHCGHEPAFHCYIFELINELCLRNFTT